MAKVTGEKVAACLRKGTGEVTVNPEYAEAARRSLNLMLELAK